MGLALGPGVVLGPGLAWLDNTHREAPKKPHNYLATPGQSILNRLACDLITHSHTHTHTHTHNTTHTYTHTHTHTHTHTWQRERERERGRMHKIHNTSQHTHTHTHTHTHDKAILVSETDEGDDNGWGDCGYSTERNLKGTVQHCVSIWVFRLDSGRAWFERRFERGCGAET